MSDKDTDIHKEPNKFSRGDTVGHGNERREIRDRDGFFPGERRGYIDRDNQVRKNDGFLPGEVVGGVRASSAHKVGGWMDGEEWGFVDDAGIVWVKTNSLAGNRQIGEVRGNKQSALAYFVLQFARLEDQFEELRKEVRNSSDKPRLYGKVCHMLEYVPNARALGDYDGLMSRIRRLQEEIRDVMREHGREKAQIVELARQWASSSDWKKADEELRELQNRFKQIGHARKEDADDLWRGLNEAVQRFRDRRSEHFAQLDRDRQRNLSRKQDLCHRAEQLSHSTDWKAAGDEFHALMEAWKAVGPVPKDLSDALWDRYRAAENVFRDARQHHFDALRRDEQNNLLLKRDLASQAENLAYSGDFRAARQEVKSLQSEWKSVGRVPKDEADPLWHRFKSACDRVYELADAEWRQKQEDAIERFEGFVESNDERIQRLRDKINEDEDRRDNARSTDFADTVQGWIDEKEEKIADLERRNEELEAKIRDIRSRV